ncbi:MAG: hypothetical protein LW817_06320, partial [Candidatus Caenarcaniphilales bacterium]|nr:hypothetical protein [Candidatus Caenarcaniphilales bacterium]
MHYFQILSLLKEKIKTPLRIVFATATENIIDTSKTCILILERHNDKQNNQKLAELIISSGLNFKNLIKEGLSSIEKNQKLETLSLDKLFDLKLDLTNILFNKLNSNPVIAEDESEFI